MRKKSLWPVVFLLLFFTGAGCMPSDGVRAGCVRSGDMHPSDEAYAEAVSPSDSLPPVSVRLLFTGDVMQHMPQVTSARRESGFDYEPVFRYVKPHFEAADLVVVNLETTLTDSPNYTGYPCFRSPAALAPALRDAGVDVAVLANNHCCDGGRTGVETTLRELGRSGIHHTGVFADSLDRRINHPLLVQLRGIRFALLNYTYGTNGINPPKGVTVNVIDTTAMACDLEEAHRGSAECIVVCVHWGEEYARRESAGQRDLAAFLRRHGADVIVGSHPHVVQPWHVDSTHVVLYSLGNFVSNQRKRYTDGGIMAGVTITRRPGGGLVFAAEVIPVWVALPGYRILPPEVADTMSLPAAYRTFREDVAGMAAESDL